MNLVECIHNYYAVIDNKDSTHPQPDDITKLIGSYNYAGAQLDQDATTGLYKIFLPVFNDLIDKETAKETAYLMSIYTKYNTSKDVVDQMLSQELLQYITNEQLSKAVEIIELYDRGLYTPMNSSDLTELNNNFQINITKFQEIWKKLGGITTTKIVIDIKDKIKNNQNDFSDYTPADIETMIKESIEKEWGETFTNSYQSLLNFFLQQLFPSGLIENKAQYEALFRKAFSEWTAEEKKSVFSNLSNKEAGAMTGGNLAYKFGDYAFGIANGLMEEIFSVFDTKNNTLKGALTGRVTTNTKVVPGSGAKSAIGVQAKTDTMLVYSTKTQMYQPDINNLFEKLSEEININHTDYWLPKSKETLKSSQFFIQMSAKDRYTSSKELHIAKEGPLGTRLGNLYSLSENELIKDVLPKEQIYTLMFLIVNSIKGLIATNQIKQVENILSTLVVLYMFDDYAYAYEQLVESQPDNRLHIYVINGNYYVLSDLLKNIRANLQDKTIPRMVSAKIGSSSKASVTYWEKQINPALQREARWINLRNKVMAEGKLSVGVSNSEALFDMIYSKLI